MQQTKVFTAEGRVENTRLTHVEFAVGPEITTIMANGGTWEEVGDVYFTRDQLPQLIEAMRSALAALELLVGDAPPTPM